MHCRNCLFILFIGILSLLTSCGSLYYPNTVNTPLLKQEGDARMNLSFGASGFDGQLAYALTNNWGVMLNGNTLGLDIETDSTSFHRHSFGEVGVGYFRNYGRRSQFELYAGGGFGKINSAWYEHDDFGDGYNRTGIVQTRRLFIQPTIARTSDFIDTAFSPRLVYVDIRGKNVSNDAYFLEPIFTMKLGYKYVKFVTQFGLSLQLKEEYDMDYMPLIASMGLQIALEGLFTKQTK